MPYQPQVGFRAVAEMSSGLAQVAPSSSLCVIHTVVGGAVRATISSSVALPGLAREREPEPLRRRIVNHTRVAAEVVVEIGDDLQRLPRLPEIATATEHDIDIAACSPLGLATFGEGQERLVRRGPNRRNPKDAIAAVAGLERHGVKQRLRYVGRVGDATRLGND